MQRPLFGNSGDNWPSGTWFHHLWYRNLFINTSCNTCAAFANKQISNLIGVLMINWSWKSSRLLSTDSLCLFKHPILVQNYFWCYCCFQRFFVTFQTFLFFYWNSVGKIIYNICFLLHYIWNYVKTSKQKYFFFKKKLQT